MYVRHLTRALELPGLARSAEPVWVTPRGVRPDIEGLERVSPATGYFLVHDWFAEPHLFEGVEAMYRDVGGELVAHAVTAGDRTDPVIEAFLDERLWLWREPIPAVPAPAVFPERPKSEPPPSKPTEVLTWIEVSLVDEAEQAVVDERVLVVDPDGNRHPLRTSQAGLARIDDIRAGVCDVSFPDVDGRDWSRKPKRFTTGGPAVRRAVTRGQHASLIVRRSGFRSLEAVWGHPENARLAAARDPNLLVPGDLLAIPTEDDRTEECATAARHPFVLRSGALRLQLRFQQPRGRPWAAGSCDVAIQGHVTNLPRNGDGLVEMDVPLDVQQVKVAGVLEESLLLWAGDLEPVDTARGVRQRLLCLGYVDVEDPDSEELRAAVEEFQCDEGLRVTGEVDGSTRTKLREVHGC